MKKYVDKEKLQEFATKLHNKQKTIFATQESIATLVGSPLVASTAADMTDTTKIYVYVGSETGYTAGNWYYYDGSDWTSGGVYNAVAFETDETLSIEGMAADAKKVGDALDNVSTDLENFEIENYVKVDSVPINLSQYFVKNAFILVNNGVFSVSDNSSYRYYVVPADGFERIAVHGFSDSTIKTVVFTDENDNMLAYYPVNKIPSPGQNVDIECDVPTGATNIHICNNKVGTAALTNIITHPNYEMGDALKDALVEVSALSGLEIEGYEKQDAVVDGTLKENYVLSAISGTEVALNGWEYCTIDCSEYKKMIVSGYAGSNVALYYLLNEAGNVIYYYPFPSVNTGYTDVVVDIPSDAKTICINGKQNSVRASAKVETYHFVKGGSSANVGQEKTGGAWEVGTGNMKTLVDMDDSNNKAFNFEHIDYDGNTFKSCTDDITPLKLSVVGYVGANHGYYFGYYATLANHGLTVADIGKTCEINGNTWELVQVNDSSHFTVVCRTDVYWFGMKTVGTVPTTFNFGSEITVTAIERSQIYPSIKNIDVSVVENNEKNFIVAESYDIVNPKTGLDAMIENVGSNDNNSFASLSDSSFTVRNLYTFDNNGACVVTQNLKTNNADAVIAFYGGTQSIAFGSSDYYAVPMTDKDEFEETGTEVNFYRSMWNDSAVPPMIYCQMDNAGASATKFMLTGIVMEDRNSFIDNSAGFVYTSRKMYPYAINPNAAEPVGTTFNLMSFRIPMYAYEMDEDMKFVGFCKVGKDYYLFVYNNTDISKTVSLPVELLGKTIQVITSKNGECLNEIVSTGVDIKLSDEGYVFMKLTG